MPWNQPGSNGNDDDPWGQRNRNSNGRQQGPPELDEVFRQVKERIDGMFSRTKGGGGDNNGGGNSVSGGNAGKGSMFILLLVGLGFWLATGFYTVDQGEQAIELRFGKYSQTNGAGLNWHFPTPFESVEIINTQRENTVQVGYREGVAGNKQHVPQEALMLTQDENIIDIQIAVQYDVKDPADLLFNVSEYNSRDLADPVVRQAAESAVREIVGRNTMDFAITEGREQIAAETQSLVQDILDRYQTGINVVTVEMQDAQPPEQVQDSFADVVRAREDEQRLKNLAEAYANDIIPKARGFASRISQEAEAYKAAVIAKAEGETSRFNQIRTEYAKAPSITRDRLYLEAMEQVYANTTKMMIDQTAGGNNVMYLPLDQLIKNQSSSKASNPSRLNTSQALGENFSGNSQGSTTRSVDRTPRQ